MSPNDALIRLRTIAVVELLSAELELPDGIIADVRNAAAAVGFRAHELKLATVDAYLAGLACSLAIAAGTTTAAEVERWLAA